MRYRVTSVRPLLLLALGFVLPACGGDDPTGPGAAEPVTETMRGYSILHAGDAPGAPWQPEPVGSQSDGYTLYDSQQRIGQVEVEFDQGTDCQASFRYSVTTAPAAAAR